MILSPLPMLMLTFDEVVALVLAEKTRLYPAEEIAGMSAEEAVVVAFLRFRLGELADRAAA